jgi:adenylate cyclase
MSQDIELNTADLHVLVSQAKDLSSELDLDYFLNDILKRACELTDSESASIFLYDEGKISYDDGTDSRGLYVAAATGPVARDFIASHGEHGRSRVPLEGSKAGRTFLTGEVLVEDAVGSDPQHFKEVDQVLKHHTDSLLCVPLAIGAERIGAMEVINKQSTDYSQRDRTLLEHFASHAALAIRNAQLVQELLAHKGLFTSRTAGRKAADLIRELSAPAHPERMTVMFADMRGFTRFSQLLGNPAEIEKHLNKFIELLATEVMRYDGFVNKFLGDGVLALFRGRQSELRAARAAFGIVDKFATLKDSWNVGRNEVLNFLDVGVGIGTGDVIIGSIGTGRIKDFTALGNVVNLAAAFEQEARGGRRVQVDQNTFNAIFAVVSKADDAVDHDLRKPDQPPGIHYKRIHVHGLVPDQATSEEPIRVDPYYHNSWAVVVGIDEYKSKEITPLSYAVSDARAVADALPAIGFPAAHIQLLENEAASRLGIQRALHEKSRMMHEADRLLVFFALHGKSVSHISGEEGFLLPYDVEPTNIPVLGLAMIELEHIARRLPPKHIIFVLDACFSGFAAYGVNVEKDSAIDLAETAKERVIEVMTAGDSSEQVIEQGGRGVFTRAFLKGLEGDADLDCTGLTASKLAAYIRMRLRTENANQTPQIRKLRGKGEFLFIPPKEYHRFPRSR